MSSTVTVRLPDTVRAELAAAAAAGSVPVGTLAAKLIADGLAGAPAGPAPDSPLVLAVRERFDAGNGDGDRMVAELAVELARQTERGGTAQAGRLLALARERLDSKAAELDTAIAEFTEHLSTPAWTHCRSCGTAYGQAP